MSNCPVSGHPCWNTECAATGTCLSSGNKLDRETMRTDPVIEAVRERFHQRSQLGIQKYGTTLHENTADHRAKLEHILSELMDGCNYIMWAIMEIDKQKAGDQQYIFHLEGALEAAKAAALAAKLPSNYQWGADAMESFNFGKECAAKAIEALAKKP